MIKAAISLYKILGRHKMRFTLNDLDKHQYYALTPEGVEKIAPGDIIPPLMDIPDDADIIEEFLKQQEVECRFYYVTD